MFLLLLLIGLIMTIAAWWLRAGFQLQIYVDGPIYHIRWWPFVAVVFLALAVASLFIK